MSIGIDILLPRLQGVRKVPPRGAGVVRAFRALCPVHQSDGPRPGRGPSLSLAETSAGHVLLHCHAGCPTDEILASLGLTLEDLFPDRLPDAGPLPGGVKAWASAAALADEVAERATLAVARGTWDDVMALMDAVRSFQAAAKEAMRAAVPAKRGATA